MAKITLNKRTEYGTLKIVNFHPAAKDTISGFPDDVRSELGYLIYRLQTGESLSMPQSRSMRSVAMGAFELRVRGEDRIYRVFYFTKSERGILIFHAFVKTSQKTPVQEISIGRKRLSELLEG